jgi:hypothetical protein
MVYMSRGILIYYKLISSENNKLIYGYSGANINKEYDERYLLEYDGVIEISIKALETKSAIQAFNDKEINILKECNYEWHQPRLVYGKDTIGFFAVRIVHEIFKEFKHDMQQPKKGGVEY